VQSWLTKASRPAGKERKVVFRGGNPGPAGQARFGIREKRIKKPTGELTVTITHTRLFEEAMKLSKRVKAKLADQLLDSMDGNQLKEVEKAWFAEIKRRLAAFKTGKLRLYSGEKVLAALKKKYQK